MNHIAALFILPTILALSTGSDINEYPLVRKLHLTGTPGDAAAIPIDTKLHHAANDDYSNFRILDENGGTVPFAVRDARVPAVKTKYIMLPGKITDFSQNPQNNTASADFTLNEPDTVSRLVFPTNSRRFDKTVSLEFFNKQGKKTEERRNLPLRQYGKIFGSASVDFIPAKAAKIRIVINRYAERKESEYRTETTGQYDQVVRKNVRNEEYDLKGIIAYKAVSEEVPGKVRTVPVNLPEIKREEKGNVTEITVDARRVPCTGLKISADDKNYNRETEIVSVENGGEKTLARFSVTPSTGLISIPECRGKYYIVKIRNGDNTPLKNIRLEWNAKEKLLVIVPPKKGDLKLYYGGRAEKQIYDIEKYADRFGLPPQIYELGEEKNSPDFAPGLPADDVYKYLMWAVLVIAAAVLFIVIVRLLNGKENAGNAKNP